MKTRFLVFLFFLSTYSFANNNEDREAKHPVGIGIRIGDFNGLSAQYFLTDAKLSFGLDVGRSYFFGDNYEERFELYAKENNIDYTVYDEEGWAEGSSIGFKLNVCKYANIGGVPHFYWYGGAGLQLRRFELDHTYQVEVKAANSTVVKENTEKANSIPHYSTGVDFILGSEYVFQEFPMTIFVDVSAFVEASELSGRLMGQIGLGARVHF